MLNNACELAKTDVNLLSEELLTKLILCGDHTFNDISNQLILQQTITFSRLSERFKIDDSFHNLDIIDSSLHKLEQFTEDLPFT